MIDTEMGESNKTIIKRDIFSNPEHPFIRFRAEYFREHSICKLLRRDTIPYIWDLDYSGYLKEGSRDVALIINIHIAYFLNNLGNQEQHLNKVSTFISDIMFNYFEKNELYRLLYDNTIYEAYKMYSSCPLFSSQIKKFASILDKESMENLILRFENW